MKKAQFVKQHQCAGKPPAVFFASRDFDLSNSRGSDWNAYLRKVRGETVVITHPCHPYSGQHLTVLHYRSGKRDSSILVEFPDRSTQCLPVSWTDRAKPDPHQVPATGEATLSGLALLELANLVESWKKGS